MSSQYQFLIISTAVIQHDYILFSYNVPIDYLIYIVCTYRKVTWDSKGQYAYAPLFMAISAEGEECFPK